MKIFKRKGKVNTIRSLSIVHLTKDRYYVVPDWIWHNTKRKNYRK